MTSSEFLKVGDKVMIKSIQWYKELLNDPRNPINYRESGSISDDIVAFGFAKSMSKYCGKVATIRTAYYSRTIPVYRIDLDNSSYFWAAYMFEDLSTEYELE